MIAGGEDRRGAVFRVPSFEFHESFSKFSNVKEVRIVSTSTSCPQQVPL
jgi:hypothetical protein